MVKVHGRFRLGAIPSDDEQELCYIKESPETLDIWSLSAYISQG
jgi:hypothetical protein